jgi:hypothetical protein
MGAPVGGDALTRPIHLLLYVVAMSDLTSLERGVSPKWKGTPPGKPFDTQKVDTIFLNVPTVYSDIPIYWDITVELSELLTSVSPLVPLVQIWVLDNRFRGCRFKCNYGINSQQIADGGEIISCFVTVNL